MPAGCRSVYDTGPSAEPEIRNAENPRQRTACAAPLISLSRGCGGGLAFFSFILYNTVCLRTAARHRPSAFPLFHFTRPMRSIRSAAHTATGGRLCRSDKMPKTQWPLLHRQGRRLCLIAFDAAPGFGRRRACFPRLPLRFSRFLLFAASLFFIFSFYFFIFVFSSPQCRETRPRHRISSAEKDTV